MITPGRSEVHARFPARFQLILAANPCPCGHAGSSGWQTNGEVFGTYLRRHLSLPWMACRPSTNSSDRRARMMLARAMDSR
jgi:hypothetical protein